MKKVAVTIRLSEDLIKRIRNAVYWNPKLTLSYFAEESLMLCIEALEEKNQGPFNQIPIDDAIKRGRRIGR